MIIAVDAFGGDFAPHEIVKGAVLAAQSSDAEIVLVGKKSLLQVQASRYLKRLNISIIDAPEVIGFDEPPVKAVRSKPDSSIVVGVNLVRDGAAQAFISAGSTGAVLAAAFLNLGKIEGVERPALASILGVNSPNPSLILDSGANADCRPNHLVQFAEMGTIYAREVLGIPTPRVGLLNNGAEPGHGNQLAKETYELLKGADHLNFIGNIEGFDILKRVADVMVTDGFTGNVVLKTIEGMAESIAQPLLSLNRAISRAPEVQGRTLLDVVGLGSITKKVDYREVGAAVLLGVRGNILVSHGRSRAKTMKNAIDLARHTAARNIAQLIKEESNGQTSSC